MYRIAVLLWENEEGETEITTFGLGDSQQVIRGKKGPWKLKQIDASKGPL